MKKMKNLFKYIFILMIIVVGVSCQKMTYDQPKTSTYPINGEWTITYEYPDGTKDGTYLLVVYNTSFSKDSVWFEDHTVGYKFKAKADVTNATFSVTNAQSVLSNSKYTIKSGKIVKNDSIYFELDFPGDPGYKVYGHRKNNSWEEYNNL